MFSIDEIEYVSAAPTKWVNKEENECFWPKNKKLERKAINLSMSPEADWEIIKDIRIFGFYDTLKEALYIERKKQDSGSEESDQGKRRIKKNKRYRDDSLSPPPILEFQLEHLSANTNHSPRPCSSHSSSSMVYVNEDVAKLPQPATNAKEDAAEVDIEQAEIMFINDNVISAEKSDNKVQLDIIVDNLFDIKASINCMAFKLEQIEKRLNMISFDDNENLLPPLPLRELSELENLEKNLKNNEQEKKQLLLLLKFTGGSRGKDCVNRCLEKLFSNYLGQFCSWTGKKNNFKLSNLTLMDILKRAVKENFPQITDQEFERSVMAWFQHATTRYRREKDS